MKFKVILVRNRKEMADPEIVGYYATKDEAMKAFNATVSSYKNEQGTGKVDTWVSCSKGVYNIEKVYSPQKIVAVSSFVRY